MLTRRTLLTAALAAPALTLLPRTAMAADPYVNASGGLAIEGIDPVAYFTEGGPRPGSADHTLMWEGAEWRFVSAENMALFEADPKAYAPQYGGYCAYAVSQGYTAPIDPEAWTIHEDKLYLNFSRRVRRIWERDIPGHIASANANWPTVLG